MSAKETPIEQIPVVILAGGQGTRIREAAENVPKPLIEIGGKPILWHIMKLYSHYGSQRFVVCLGYKSWLIKEYFLRYREHLSDVTLHLAQDNGVVFHNRPAEEDWEVTLAETGLKAGTGARLHRVREYVDADTFMFTYGDGIGEVDIAKLLEFHRSHGKIGTVTGVHPTSRYGEMRVDGSTVAEFNEKPTRPEGFVSGGFFVLQREFFDYLTDEEDLLFEQAPLQNLARDGQLAVFPHEGFWMGMDTFREYTELNKMWDSDQAPWRVWQKD
jgi:glucose-1-phosphate cytidylyltransferase